MFGIRSASRLIGVRLSHAIYFLFFFGSVALTRPVYQKKWYTRTLHTIMNTTCTDNASNQIAVQQAPAKGQTNKLQRTRTLLQTNTSLNFNDDDLQLFCSTVKDMVVSKHSPEDPLMAEFREFCLEFFEVHVGSVLRVLSQKQTFLRSNVQQRTAFLMIVKELSLAQSMMFLLYDGFDVLMEMITHLLQHHDNDEEVKGDMLLLDSVFCDALQLSHASTSVQTFIVNSPSLPRMLAVVRSIYPTFGSFTFVSLLMSGPLFASVLVQVLRFFGPEHYHSKTIISYLYNSCDDDAKQKLYAFWPERVFTLLDFRFVDTRTPQTEKCCPILLTEMVDPVVASDGFTYERNAILTCMLTSLTSPMTRDVLDAVVHAPEHSAPYTYHVDTTLRTVVVARSAAGRP